MTELKMTAAQIGEFLSEVFPEAFPALAQAFAVSSLAPGQATVVFNAEPQHLRPGGTVSGPALMTLADVAMYILVLAHIGPVALAVTTNLNINFLRKPQPGGLVAEARLLKLGRSLAVGDVVIAAANDAETAVAHASVTYAIPPR